MKRKVNFYVEDGRLIGQTEDGEEFDLEAYDGTIWSDVLPVFFKQEGVRKLKVKHETDEENPTQTQNPS